MIKYCKLIYAVFFCVYTQGTKLGVVSSEDLITILASNPKMKRLLCETANALVQRETGSIAGIERAVQAATAPSVGQQMLQRGSRYTVANGISREESRVSINAEGSEVVERLVERGVILPGGQGVHIQQAVQQVISADSELGKRKTDADFEKVEIRRLNLMCDKMQLENDQLEKKHAMDNDQLEKKHAMDNIANKLTTVNNFMSTMQLLDPTWRETDQRLVLQATDYIKNSIFSASSAPQIENGAAQLSESISISQVAFELGISMCSSKAISAGKNAARLYKDKYGESPSKHKQTIGGRIFSVNSYTLRDRDLVASAIQLVT